jgi:hypothetical protein
MAERLVTAHRHGLTGAASAHPRYVRFIGRAFTSVRTAEGPEQLDRLPAESKVSPYGSHS